MTQLADITSSLYRELALAGEDSRAAPGGGGGTWDPETPSVGFADISPASGRETMEFKSAPLAALPLAAVFSASGKIPPALTRADIAEAAARLRTDPARLRAVIRVESAGRGFHPRTGLPVILFEPHVFHRETDGRHARARPDLSYPSWGARAYPRSQTERWRQLRAAAALDASAALRSTSWGLFQIMGFNHRACGFNTVEAFARAHARGERDQLPAFAAFLESRDLAAALREGRWAEFARAYNGPAYARHAYDQRLKAADAAERAGT